MIYYMPFTHIEEPHMTMLAGAFGCIALCSPAEALVPDRMRQWEREALLEIRYPYQVEGDRLIAVVRDYKAWAQMHQGRIGDMAEFFKFRPERFVMMEDTNPSQIRHQVRHYGEPPGSETEDPLIDAALFLSLAQEFDTQQYAMDREMDAVQALERQMMQKISGRGGDAEDLLPETGAPPISRRDYAFLPEMIPQRVRAWALLALNDGDSPWLYVTRSRPVVEHLLDHFPEGDVIYDQPLISAEKEPLIPPARMREMLQAMSVDAAEPAIEAPAKPGEPVPNVRLIIHRLSGVAPPDFLETLCGQGATAQRPDPLTDVPDHTLIGLVTADSVGTP